MSSCRALALLLIENFEDLECTMLIVSSYWYQLVCCGSTSRVVFSNAPTSMFLTGLIFLLVVGATNPSQILWVLGHIQRDGGFLETK
jgi:hypothetical protein